MTLFTRFSRRAMIASSLALVVAATPAFARSPVPDTSFTIAVLPDTQNYMDYSHQKADGFPFDANELFFAQMRYIADNVESAGGDIAFVTSLGDVWQHQSLRMDPDHAARGFKSVPNPIFDSHFAPTPKVQTIEMPAAKKGFEIIAGKVPFSVVPGNHDYDAMWTDANHPPAAQVNPRDLTTLGMLHPGGLNNFRSVFGADTAFFKGKPWYVASHDGGADSAQIFEAGGYRFLHIGLQFDAPNASLEWAASIIAQHPGLPTIVSTHDYMDQKGRRIANPVIDAHAVDEQDNNPEMVWQKFISQHDQIFMLLCGHQHGQALRTDTNKFGHKVYQVLADYQDRGQTAIAAGVKSAWPVGIGDGWMRLMTFDLAGEKPAIRVRTYSTHYKQSSKDTLEYAQWYKAGEQPDMTNEQFHAADDFTIDLTDFHSRFKPAAAHAR
ncbi:metallophosphoesterase [Sphingomonas sp. KC8]|uniref:metallophosphoesterase n=1 Tax=Sphingomonas sp. KC8 TaxID=1030157 RepID=UPI000248BB9D|nr:metallophosphoesterase [Sphingomonas sp. KC8]ARS28501.1 serine/threonine protein phosphatase [Sphingomonas sp. KC8]